MNAPPATSPGASAAPSPPGAPATWRDALPALLALHLFLLLFLRPTLGIGPWVGHEWIFAEVRTHLLAELWQASGPSTAPWLPDAGLGYGIPFFTFYAPLGYYVGALLHFVLRLSSTAATTLSFHLAYVTSAWTMLLLGLEVARDLPARRRWGWAAAAAIVYCTTPFHITDIVIRKGLASGWSWMALPGILYGVERLRRDPLGGALAAALFTALLVLSHNIAALYGAVIVALYVLMTFTSLRSLLTAVAAALGGLLLSAWFWVPALALKSLVRANSVDRMWGHPETLEKNAPTLKRLFLETYNIYGAAHLGVVVAACVLLAIAAVALGKVKGRPHRRAAAAALLFVVLTFAMTKKMPWEVVPDTFRYIQFSWRLLTFTSLLGSLALVSITPWTDRWMNPVYPGLVAGTVGIIVLPMCLTRFDVPLTDENLVTQYAEIERGAVYLGCMENDYLPLTVDPKYYDAKYLAANPPPPNRLAVTQGDLNVLEFRRTGARYEYVYDAPAPAEVTLHLFAFPGWTAQLDDSAPQSLDYLPASAAPASASDSTTTLATSSSATDTTATATLPPAAPASSDEATTTPAPTVAHTSVSDAADTATFASSSDTSASVAPPPLVSPSLPADGALAQSADGLLTARLPAGRHTWTVAYARPPIGRATAALSLAAFAVWVGLAVYALLLLRAGQRPTPA